MMEKKRFFATLKYARQMNPYDPILRQLLLKLFQYAYTLGWQDNTIK